MGKIRLGTVLVGLALWFAPMAGASVDACCFDDGSCEALRTDVCLEAGGEKPGAPVCDPNPCAQPVGGSCAGETPCQAGLVCVDEICLARAAAPVASGSGLLLLAGGLALVGSFAARRGRD
jgi:hypothetical protein